ncbi:HEAT repeat protein [Stieleria bergensis]|uniref:HEAT repeat protein n=2 Tax=Stieleria bergensis TaxID=2528025 RepID=A0A517SVE0_9BACT|nr:HEAT repeat protein [Planctomycetes bacterium SV_7m_r]
MLRSLARMFVLSGLVTLTMGLVAPLHAAPPKPTPEDQREGMKRVDAFGKMIVGRVFDAREVSPKRADAVRQSNHDEVVAFSMTLKTSEERLHFANMLLDDIVEILTDRTLAEVAGPLLKDQDLRVQNWAFLAIHKSKSGARYAKELIALAGKEDPPKQWLTHLIWAMRSSDHEAFTQPLVKFTRHADTEIRREAVIALPHLSPEQTLKVTPQLLNDKDRVIRHLAIRALGRSRVPEAFPLIRPLLTHKSWLIREEGIEALVDLTKTSDWKTNPVMLKKVRDAFGPQLRKALSDEYRRVREKASETMRVLGIPRKANKARDSASTTTSTGNAAENIGVDIDDNGTKTDEKELPIAKAKLAEAAAVADTFIKLAAKSDQPLTAQQLQPLVKQLWVDWHEANEAVKAFVKMGPKAAAAVDAILPGTIDDSAPKKWTFGSSAPLGEFHREALKAIGAAAVPALCKVVNDENAKFELREQAQRVLSDLRPRPEDRELYIDTMLAQRDEGNSLSTFAIAALAQMGYRDLWMAIPILSDAERLRDPMYGDLPLALHYIRPVIDQAIKDGVPVKSWWTPKLRDRLLASLGDANASMFGPSHKIIALFVLAGDDAIVPYLLDYVRNGKAGGLAAVSAWALGELNRKEALEDVLDLLTRIPLDDLYQTEFRPIAAAGKLGGKEAVPALIEMLKSDRGAAEHAALALARIGDKRAVEPVKALFKRSLKGGPALQHTMTAMVMFGEDDAVDQTIKQVFRPGRNWDRIGPEHVIEAILDLKDIKLRHHGIRLIMQGTFNPPKGIHHTVLPDIREVFAKRFGLEENGFIEPHEFRQWWEMNWTRFGEGE